MHSSRAPDVSMIIVLWCDPYFVMFCFSNRLAYVQRRWGWAARHWQGWSAHCWAQTCAKAPSQGHHPIDVHTPYTQCLMLTWALYCEMYIVVHCLNNRLVNVLPWRGWDARHWWCRGARRGAQTRTKAPSQGHCPIVAYTPCAQCLMLAWASYCELYIL